MVILDMIFIDTEYQGKENAFVNPVCAVYGFLTLDTDTWEVTNVTECKRKWLWRNEEAQSLFLEEFKKDAEGKTIVCFNAMAEASFLDSVGFDLESVGWFDLYVEWLQAQNQCNEFLYGGVVWDYGKVVQSVPPYMKGLHLQAPRHYGGMIAHELGINIDSQHKKEMRDLIIYQDPDEDFTSEQKKLILDYCYGDTRYFPQVMTKYPKRLPKLMGLSTDDYVKSAANRSRYMLNVYYITKNGIPLNLDYLESLTDNYEDAVDEIVSNLNEKYEFFKKVRGPDTDHRWVDTYSQFKKYIESRGLHDNWPTTDKGLYCIDNDTLELYDGDEVIELYRNTRKIIKQLSYFREGAGLKLYNNIGTDGRIRVFMNPYGSQTGRNQPAPSKGFIPAMSAWTRCLIHSKESYIIATDFSSQEFFVAAVMSQCPNMIRAYLSGDPYFYFAKLVKAVPFDGDKSEYAHVRKLFKSTILGVQYGMAAFNLSIKLAHDTGKPFTEAAAQKLIDYHKQAFPEYWQYLYNTVEAYRDRGAVVLKDGWAMLKNNTNALSIRNMPLQGTGAVILRRAIDISIEQGLKVLFSVHDEIVIETKYPERDKKKLEDAMLEASAIVLGREGMRVESEVYAPGQDYVTEKGEKFYNIFKKYLVKNPDKQKKEELKKKIYKKL